MKTYQAAKEKAPGLHHARIVHGDVAWGLDLGSCIGSTAFIVFNLSAPLCETGVFGEVCALHI
jgi:hypothetical protein